MYLRVDSDSSLYRLLVDFLQAYNRRTDVMEASTDLSVQRQVDALTQRVQGQTDALDTAVEKAKET